jgi:hypothetical protein
MFIKRVYKDMIGFGQGSQIWKAVPRHEINIVIMRFDKELADCVQELSLGSLALEL